MNAIRMPKYVDSYEYATLVNEAGKNVGLNPTYSPDDLQKYQDGSDPYLHPNVDWTNVVLRSQAMQTINNLGVTGGTESVKYYVNLGYTTQQGIYKEDKSVPYSTNALLKKYNFRTNIDVKLSKNISMELGLSAIIQNTNFPGQSAPAIFESLKLVTPLSMPLINPNGSIPANNGDLVLNPFSRSTQTGYTKQFYNTLVSNLGFKWDLSSITEGLSVRALSAFDVVDITQNIRSRTPATFKYSKDQAGNDVYQPMALEQKLSLRNAYETYRTIYIETSANYDRVFAKKHTVSGMLLARRREFVNIGELNSRLNLPERSQGIVTRLTYNYDNRYVMEANAAYNGSEQFPKGKQYGIFPSIGGAWLISNEKFWKESKVISLFKLRGSYGLVGNDRLAYPVTEASRFLFQTIVTQGGAGYPYGIDMNNGKGGIIESRFGTEDVTWELAKKANIGFNLEMYDGKINLTADFFRERREDQLLRRQSLPQYSGYAGSAPYGNVGLSTSKGFEAGLQVRNTTKGGFYYAFNGTFSYAKSQILENDLPRPLYDYQELRGSVIGANLGYEALGFFQSQAEIDASPSQKPLMSIIRPGDIKYKDQNGDGLINDNDRVIIGKNGTEPQIMYGFGTTFAYKGFDMSIYFTGAAKRDFFFNARNFSMWPFQGALGNYNVNQEYYDHRWIPGQDNSKAIYPAIIPGSTNNYTISTTWMRSGSYLKIKNAEVGYTLPRNVTKRIGISNARVFAQGTNLAIWDEIKIVDPESDFGTGGYPTTRNFNFGLEVSF
jgi:TonB-linked SusC/RagA family outer membrane protein